MPEKLKHISEYSSGRMELVRSTCLFLATVLGDQLEEIVIVGGLVPSLIIDQGPSAPDIEKHVGTMDLDLGLALSVLDGHRYQAFADRLRGAGFSADVKENGNRVVQRWRTPDQESATVDFLIPQAASEAAGTIKHLEADFGAIICPGLQLAFRDSVRVHLEGRTVRGEQASRVVNVCGPGAFVLLKARALSLRGANKDAYDLYYVIRNYGNSVEDVAGHLRPLMDDPDATSAMKMLRRDFLDHDGIGPMRVSDFLYGHPDDNVQADVVGVVAELMRLFA